MLNEIYTVLFILSQTGALILLRRISLYDVSLITADSMFGFAFTGG